MGIDTYTTQEAIALLDKIGWPEWPDVYYPRGKERLGFRNPGFEAIDWQHERFALPDLIALCLIRNHLREYVESKSVFLIANSNDEFLLARARAEAERSTK